MRVRGYPDYLVNKVLAEVKFTNGRSALEQKPQRMRSGLMPLVTQYNPSVPNLKKCFNEQVAFEKESTIAERNIQRTTFHFLQERQIKSLKDILVRAKL